MSIVDAFDSGEEKRNKSHIRNLIRLALLDGEISEAEREMIFKVGRREGITPEEIQDLLDAPDSITFNPPSELERKLERYVSLVRMVLTDGVVDQDEAKLLHRMGIGLGLNEEKISDYTQKAAQMVKESADMEDIVEALMKK